MYDLCDIEFGPIGYDVNPGRQTFAGFGYDKENYISTAGLVSSPYTSTPLIQSRIGGVIKLIESVDDSVPPVGDLTGPALATLNNVIQNVTTEINGYLSSIYPIPLVQTGTVAIIQVTGVSTDGLGSVTSINVLEAGNYLSAPATTNTPSYMRYLDPLANLNYWGQNWENCQTGTGLILTVTYATQPYADEGGSSLNAYKITGTPVIATAGTGYNVNDLLVLVGGSSFVPAKIREAALVLICHDLCQRRLAPDEFNTFKVQARKWRGERDTDGMLTEIGEGNLQLDGTYKRFFSAGAVWGQKSVLFGANSL